MGVDFKATICKTKIVPEPTIFLIFSTSFLVALSGALMPGPVLAVDIAESAKRGFWAGPLIVLGHGIVELILVAAVLGGLSQLLEEGPVTAIIALLGGLFLLWMGFAMIRTAPRQSLPQHASAARRGLSLRPVLAGAVASVSNPYWWIWWATVGLAYMLWSWKLGTWAVAFFYGGHILADLSWYALVALIVATGRRWMSDRVYRVILIVCGAFLIGLAAYFVVTGIQFFA